MGKLRFLAVLVLVLLPHDARADLIAPPKAQGALAHAGLLDATLYGADPTGKTDSTKAIQAAINDGRDFLMTTYLPAGTYLISDTLLGTEDGSGSGATFCYQVASNTGSALGGQYFAARAPTLVGPPNGARAVLKLADGSAGFGDPKNPKAAVHFVDQGPPSQYVDGVVGAFDCMMYSVIRDIDVDLGANNAGAIGVEFFSAQFSYMANVSVKASGAYAGIHGSPATTDWVNLTVDGGQYGILMNNGGTSSIVGVTLTNQTVAGMRVQALGASTLVGFHISESQGAAFQVAVFNGVPQNTSFALVDGTIEQTDATQPAIANLGAINLLVQNVWAKTPGALVTSGTKSLAGSGKFDAIGEYVYTNTAVTNATYAPNTSYDVVDGVTGQKGLARVTLDAPAPPTDLVLRHLPGALPWISDPGVVDATTLGADPTGAKDATAAIQNAIDASEGKGDEVFLPRGSYLVSGTLNLHPNTKLFGVPGPKTTLWATTWDPNGVLTPFIRTADTATGRTFVGDVQILLPDDDKDGLGYAQSYLNAIDWRAGRSSVMWQAAVNLIPDWNTTSQTATAPRSVIHASGNGGGKWYGLQLGGELVNGRDQDHAFRFVLVDATTAPLSLYGPNFEHGLGDSFVEVSHAANFRVFETKTECRSTWANVHDSKNVLIAGVGGDWAPSMTQAGMLSTNNTNVEMANLGWYGPEGAQQGTYVASVAWANGVSVYQEGTIDDSAFPHCGDGVCDGAEDATSCSSDCTTSSSPPDGGTSPEASDEAGAQPPAPSDGTSNGCACSTTAEPRGGSSLWALLALALLARRSAR